MSTPTEKGPSDLETIEPNKVCMPFNWIALPSLLYLPCQLATCSLYFFVFLGATASDPS